jgi:hypothetical protein
MVKLARFKQEPWHEAEIQLLPSDARFPGAWPRQPTVWYEPRQTPIDRSRSRYWTIIRKQSAEKHRKTI